MTTALGIPGVGVGHATDREACTGCTVVLVPAGAVAAVDVRGGAPGTRETDLLSPLGSVAELHAVVLCGGSAPGLGAADGVVAFLEERGLGYETPYARVPLVSGAVIYDRGLGERGARPGPADGYRAAAAAAEALGLGTRDHTRDADADRPAVSSVVAAAEEGSVGVGTGATVGKILGEAGWMKGGVGIATLDLPGRARVTALTVVNAFGDVLDEAGAILAGARMAGGAFVDTRRFVLAAEDHPHFNRMAEATTLSVVVTDAAVTKTQCAVVARVAHDGMARAVSPVHTPVDGDAVFVVSAGERPANVFQLGVAAVDVVAASVRRAVRVAESLGGAPAVRDLHPAPATAGSGEVG